MSALGILLYEGLRGAMIIECPECGAKNSTVQPPQPNKRYRCGKCGAVITSLQTTDTPSETVIREESRKWNWSDALKSDGRFSRSQFAFFYFVPIISTYILFAIAGVLEIFLIIAIPWALFQTYVVIVAGIRRLHDLNYSGWYLLFGFIPFANIALILYLLLAPGKVEGNRWLTGSELVKEK